MENSADIYRFLGLKRTSKTPGFPRVLTIISSLLERSVHRNELLLGTAEFKDDTITIFHGLRAPTLSIREYIDRIFKYAGCSPSCFVVAFIYVDRFIRCTNAQLTYLNVHRLLITSVMLAAKFVDDKVFKNAYYAKVGGVSSGELKRLEMKFLESIGFRLHVSVEGFDRICGQLKREAQEQEEEMKIGRRERLNNFIACGVEESWSSNDDSSCAPTIAG